MLMKDNETMNDSLREKFPVGWRELRGELRSIPGSGKFEQRPEVQNDVVVWGGVVRIPCERGAKWKWGQKEGVGQIGS